MQNFLGMNMNNKERLFLLLGIVGLFLITACEKGETSQSEDTVRTGTHEDPDDYTWDSTTVIPVVLNGNSISVASDGATVSGSNVTITSAGNYSISGTLTDGQIVVNTEDEATVRLILNGASISSSKCAPVNIIKAEKTIIVLADNTTNQVTDGTSENTADDDPNAAIFSKDDLTIFGNGSLTVKGNYNDGITSKDGLIIKSGTLSVTATDDGIRGKDYLIVESGNITVNSGGDGFKSDNETSPMGYISIDDGVFNITSGGDGIQAKTDVTITQGTFTLTAGGGSSKSKGSVSTKGIKADSNLDIQGGIFIISSADDALHSDANMVLDGDSFTLSTSDDGMHADSTLEIDGGNIDITKSYEGIESAIITINAGNIHVTSSDDGINGSDGSSSTGGTPGQPGQGGGGTYSSGNCFLYINGGYIAVDATGDGLDVNGGIQMTGGTVIVNGPTANDNGALDYDSSFIISGGFLVATGSSGMAQAPGSSSTQYSVLVNFRSTLSAGTLFHIQASDGTDIVTFKPTRQYQSVAFSSSSLKRGSAYSVYYSGSSTGTLTDGIYSSGTYTPGTQYSSFTVSSVVTKVQ